MEAVRILRKIAYYLYVERGQSESTLAAGDDADRRAHWASVFANKDFVDGFAVKFRPLLTSQEVKRLTAAP